MLGFVLRTSAGDESTYLMANWYDEGFVKLDISTVIARFRRIFLIGTCLLIALAGCSNGQSDTVRQDHLVLKLESNQSRAHVGEPVQIRFTITNTDREPIEIESKNAPVMDIYVEVVGDGPLLTWSGLFPDQVSHRLRWQPGESKVIELTWIPKPGDIYDGEYHDIYLTGSLTRESGGTGAGVRICASNFCR